MRKQLGLDERSVGIPVKKMVPPSEGTSVQQKSDPIVLVENGGFAYGRNSILESVEMKIKDGEFWCFIGPNGEGKTTFIKALLGALRPKRGLIRLRADFARRTRIGFVPQSCDLNPSVPTTIESFVKQGTAGLNVERTKLNHRVRRALEVMGIQFIRERSIWRVSGGQRQRAMVARALVRDPLMMIVDEPTAGLDLAASSGLLKTITELNQKHKITVIFVTHDLQLAGRYASHVAIFKNKRVINGPIGEILTGKNLEKAFGVPTEVKQTSSGEYTVRSKVEFQEASV
ncbi:MAG: ABC transporter ATP-binding protein [Verrucomicrobia bacterium]|nr:ABC transporter ATP-binding protein [Verrucomicrobiota bacterium]MBT4275848.1 ABC transporter ATP-binding protein [Verrucomicrobiota bacterium]MBT5064575.1 ABC transporter ATP-binding protein [Verrucomicrobiota bacterium]MBT5480473.1 ABC transporter ATP-binding protein [Verrucomicrobiota bacterium]MBT6803486.1 ABC transporter ATP-binding protein [Verrucomicrobiota bacterium]